MKLSKSQLAWMLSVIFDDEMKALEQELPKPTDKCIPLDYGEGYLGFSFPCPPEQSFYLCNSLSVQKCGTPETPDPYDCGEDAVAFQCVNTEEVNERPVFECSTAKFECADIGFRCIGDYTCPEQGGFQCDAAVFECLNEDDSEWVFSCSDAVNQFDCVGEDLYDFSCNRGADPDSPTPLPFTCPSTEINPSFVCNAKHIFGCWTTFSCPRTHFCNPPSSGCDETHRWAPADPDDDGEPSDFTCKTFTCDGVTAMPGQGFDCQAASQFKCYDGTGIPTEKFSCGANSNFECGQEQEGYVCHNYTCPINFRCTEAFICGDLTGTLPFECSGTSTETAFSCLAIPMPLPGWLTFDCGGGPSWEHCFKCHDTPWPTESFKCPAFNCNGIFHP